MSAELHSRIILASLKRRSLRITSCLRPSPPNHPHSQSQGADVYRQTPQVTSLHGPTWQSSLSVPIPRGILTITAYIAKRTARTHAYLTNPTRTVLEIVYNPRGVLQIQQDRPGNHEIVVEESGEAHDSPSPPVPCPTEEPAAQGQSRTIRARRCVILVGMCIVLVVQHMVHRDPINVVRRLAGKCCGFNQ